MSLSIASGPTDTPLIEQTISANLDSTAARFPDRQAMVDVQAGKRSTSADLARDADGPARGFAGTRLAKAARVGLRAPICADWTL